MNRDAAGVIAGSSGRRGARRLLGALTALKEGDLPVHLPIEREGNRGKVAREERIEAGAPDHVSKPELLATVEKRIR